MVSSSVALKSDVGRQDLPNLDDEEKKESKCIFLYGMFTAPRSAHR